jgi:hypothetical protein
MNPILCSLLFVLPGQTPSNDGLPGTPATRLETMKKAMAVVEMRSAGTAGDAAYRLKTEPVLRFTNTVGDSRDGSIFLWLGEADRPGAAVQVFKTRGAWMQEWTSLSPAPLIANMAGSADWNPRRVGVEFKPVPEAPKPADGANERLRQVRALTRDFGARDFFRGQAWQPLRMMPKPMARYGKPGSDVIDGALFAFVLTTDPEAWLMLEARQSKEGLQWQFAFAPMSCYPLEGSFKERVVWSQDWLPQGRSDLPFYQFPFEPKD